MQREALTRAQSGQSFANYAAIFEGFEAKGIAPGDIIPRENVLTYQAWRGLGRQVRRGERGVKVSTFVEMTKQDPNDPAKVETFKRPRATTVFHLTQTDPVE
jgi:hypothetical protein